jgi:hypothetical protein
MAEPTPHCTVHLAREAPIRCDRCRKPYCMDCLHRVQGGMVCTHCLEELERALDARGLPARLRRLPAVLLAIAVVGAVVWGGSAGVGKLVGPAGSLASMECAAEGLGMGPALGGGAPAPTVAHAATPAALASPVPAALAIRSWTISPTELVVHLHGAGFVPNGLVCVTGDLSGQGRDGRSRRDSVGPFGVQASAGGVFSDTVDFGSAPGGYADGYTVNVGAAAVAGSPRGGGSAGVRAVVKGTTLTISGAAGS